MFLTPGYSLKIAKFIIEFVLLFFLSRSKALNRPFCTKRCIWEPFEMDLQGFRLDVSLASFLLPRLVLVVCLTSCIMPLLMIVGFLLVTVNETKQRLLVVNQPPRRFGVE